MIRRLFIPLVFICVLLLSSCGLLPNPVSESGFFLYYLNDELDQLETESYTPTASETEAMIAEIILQQNTAPGDKELRSLLPDSVSIQSYQLNGTTLTLDFSNAYNDMVIGREMLVRGGLVREFLQIAGVERVIFTVSGQPLTDSYGNEIGMMSNESFVENSAETINSYQSVTMMLYFADSTGTRLLPESRKVYYTSSEPLEKAVVEEITSGPRLSGHYPTYLSDSSVLSVIVQDDVCYVNFDSSVLSSTISVSEEVQIYSIVNSLADTCGIKQVQFSVNGDSSSVFRKDINLGVPYIREESLVDRG